MASKLTTVLKSQFAELKVTTIRLHEPKPQPANAPELVNALWKEHVTKSDWFDPDKEALVVFALNTKLNCTGFFLISLGTINETCAHPREIFKPLIAASAYGFVMAHNHPSGDPSPSEADRRLTRRIREAAELLSIHFLDHVVIGEAGEGRMMPYFSFKECGLI